ncbi:hypothetical protein AVEN_52461-1 [Araneus ventricosus]|uniref:Uncharacterized protein n=1 Tax=Araneus ventricosus TaxID=182803 RepID=A0A4Y2CY18_ARAVE|nr:hypothetical protein AVEN_52461-1 [Araneus ventricosus]
MTYSTKVLVFVVICSQMFFWDWRNCTARGEVESFAGAETGRDEGSKSANGKAARTCYGPYFREFCSEEFPCCFWDGKNHTCKPAREEGEECTHNALGYNTNFCFCKTGLFCVNSKICPQKSPAPHRPPFSRYIAKYNFGRVPQLIQPPMARHSVHFEENYNDLSMILEKINYHEHRWMVCGDFKMLTMLLGHHAGYTKYPCFLCLWDSRVRDLHWTKTD